MKPLSLEHINLLGSCLPVKGLINEINVYLKCGLHVLYAYKR